MGFVQFTQEMIQKKPKGDRRKVFKAQITQRTIRMPGHLRNVLGTTGKVQIAWDDETKTIKLTGAEDGWDMPGKSLTAGGEFCRYFGITYRGVCEAKVEDNSILIKVPE